VHRDIDDEVPPGEFRFVAPEVIALDRQALQRPQGVFDTAAAGPLRVDLPGALSPGQSGKFAFWNTGPFECVDCGLRMLSIVNHGHDSVRQVPQGVSVVIRLHRTSEGFNLECQCRSRTLPPS
jgi:hypothetical protein